MPECSIKTSSPFLCTLSVSLSSSKHPEHTPDRTSGMPAAHGHPPGGRTGLLSPLQAEVSELHPDPASQSLGVNISQSVGSQVTSVLTDLASSPPELSQGHSLPSCSWQEKVSGGAGVSSMPS